MEPVEINAGAWYLRALRADDWFADVCYAWAVCEPTTGDPVAEVSLDPSTGAVHVSARDGHHDAASAASESVRRFASNLILKPR